MLHKGQEDDRKHTYVRRTAHVNDIRIWKLPKYGPRIQWKAFENAQLAPQGLPSRRRNRNQDYIASLIRKHAQRRIARVQATYVAYQIKQARQIVDLSHRRPVTQNTPSITVVGHIGHD